jgi:hypothetical protein
VTGARSRKTDKTNPICSGHFQRSSAYDTVQIFNDQGRDIMLRGNLSAARRKSEQARSLDLDNPVIANSSFSWQPTVHRKAAE